MNKNDQFEQARRENLRRIVASLERSSAEQKAKELNLATKPKGFFAWLKTF